MNSWVPKLLSSVYIAPVDVDILAAALPAGPMPSRQ